MTIADREERNFQLFKNMSENIHKDKRHLDWPSWKFETKANFFMSANSRDYRFTWPNYEDIYRKWRKI